MSELDTLFYISVLAVENLAFDEVLMIPAAKCKFGVWMNAGFGIAAFLIPTTAAEVSVISAYALKNRSQNGDIFEDIFISLDCDPHHASV